MQNNKNVEIKWLNLRDRSEIKSHRGQKKPPEEGLKQLDFNIERQFVSANPDKTGRKIRVNDAAVKILFKKFRSEKEEFYYDRDIRHFNISERKRHASNNATHVQMIEGDADPVFAKALNLIKGKELKDRFIEEWQQVTVQTFENHIQHIEQYSQKTKSPKYGMYNITEPRTILAGKIKKSGFRAEQIASKIPEIKLATIYRHLDGTIDISRDQAIHYAKFFGVDPSEMMFNSLSVHIEGIINLEGKITYTIDPDNITDALKELKEKTRRALEGDQTAFAKERVNCPREIYRPDIRALKIDANNRTYNGNIVFYYESNKDPLLMNFVFLKI